MGAEQSAMVCYARTYSTTQPMSPLVRQMHLAVMQNDLTKLLWLLRLGVDVNYPWINPTQPSIKDGCTALSEAVSLNHIDAARALLEAGASVHTVDRDGFSLLHRAAYHGRHVIAKILVDSGADIYALDKDGNTPLHMSVKNGFVHNNARCVLTLIACGAQVNSRNTRGQTPLHFAAAWALPEIASILIDYRADIDDLDDDYLTPIHYCLLPVIDQQHRKPASLMRETFRRYLPTIMLLLHCGCDSLGLATWLKNRPAIASGIDDPQFVAWSARNGQESLKHLCRIYLQNYLGFTNVRHKYCLRKVKKFNIPETLKEYLGRRLLPE